jgi:transposase-like protein
VAADQLEQAQAVLASPIPQEVIEESQIKVPEFELPGCPMCGASDPLLESADPVNEWLCESCGAQWSDPEDASENG